MSLHYKLTNETKTLGCGTVVYRIRATRDLPYHNVKKGDLGGWVESTRNLSGEAWVANEAVVYENACVLGWAVVSDNALVRGWARVKGHAHVYGHAWVYGHAQVYDNALVLGMAQVHDSAQVYNRAILGGNARVYGQAQVRNDAQVYDNARVYGCALVADYASVCGQSRVASWGFVYEQKHVMTVTVHTSTRLEATLFKDSKKGHHIIIGCWEGTINELEKLIQQRKWIETEGQDVLEAREEMQDLCRIFRTRIGRWTNEA